MKQRKFATGYKWLEILTGKWAMGAVTNLYQKALKDKLTFLLSQC